MPTCAMKVKTGQSFQRDGFANTNEGKQLMQSPKKTKRKMAKIQLGGEQLKRQGLAAMLSSLGTKNEIILNSAIAAGFDQSGPS